MLSRILNTAIAFVWLFSGVYCKLLDLEPRHRAIVARVLGEDMAGWATTAIGALEVLMGLWVLTRITPRLCAVTQILVVAAMNILEFFLAPDLLLFGHLNALFAFFFLVIVYVNAFVLNSSAPAREKQPRSTARAR